MVGKVELAREIIFNAAKGIVTMFPTLRRVHTQIRAYLFQWCASIVEETDNSVSEIESSQLTKSESPQLVKVPLNTSIAGVPAATCLNSVRRNYSQAIAYACQSMNADKDEIDKNEWIIEKMKLEPFSLFPLGSDGQPVTDGQSVELNGLAHRNNISELADKTFICEPILSVKRKRDVDASIDNICPDLASLIYRSPYRNILLNQHYFDLYESMTRWLNIDWTTELQMKYVCAQVLAGAVLLNTNNGEAIIINTIEIYGDMKSVDIHRALSSPSNDLYAIPSAMYSDIWPSVYNTRDGRKLTINSHSCSGLATSNLRLDI